MKPDILASRFFIGHRPYKYSNERYPANSLLPILDGEEEIAR